MRSTLARAAAATMLGAALLSGCASSPLDQANEKADPALKSIAVKDNGDKTPTLTLDDGKAADVKTTSAFVAKEGTGATIGKDSVVEVRVSYFGGKKGAPITGVGAVPDNLEKTAVSLAAPDLPAYLKDGLDGRKLGAEVIVGMSAKDTGTDQGAQGGLAKDESLLFVLKPVKIFNQKGVTGKAVTPPQGLPKTTFHEGKPATITIPKSAPPTKLVAQTLVEGTGPVVKKGQQAIVTYTGALWGTGKVFDSSFTRGQPTPLALNEQGTIPGFIEGLSGRKIGSRLLLIIPPKEGYGPQGNAQAGIKGTDTLVFLVDIIDAV